MTTDEVALEATKLPKANQELTNARLEQKIKENALEEKTSPKSKSPKTAAEIADEIADIDDELKVADPKDIPGLESRKRDLQRQRTDTLKGIKPTCFCNV